MRIALAIDREHSGSVGSYLSSALELPGARTSLGHESSRNRKPWLPIEIPLGPCPHTSSQPKSRRVERRRSASAQSHDLNVGGPAAVHKEMVGCSPLATAEGETFKLVILDLLYRVCYSMSLLIISCHPYEASQKTGSALWGGPELD
jgi:hypothetical protein